MRQLLPMHARDSCWRKHTNITATPYSPAQAPHLLLKLLQLTQHTGEAVNQHLGVLCLTQGILQQACRSTTALERMLQGATQLIYLIRHSANQEYDASSDILITAELHVFTVAGARAATTQQDPPMIMLAGTMVPCFKYSSASFPCMQSTRRCQNQS